MRLLGNIIWLLCGGVATALEYLVGGTLMCLTVIGIPFGLQVFKLVPLALWPFGMKVVYVDCTPGCINLLLNILWLLLGGIWIALTHLLFGLLLCVTVLGIPFGLQHFKLMRIALSPFGKNVIPLRVL
ncbi:MAG: YccF domain-containing protein [Rikenellaceae bacterium]|nr:YccF domain-containing protein [Rikenellaceae bacterium]